MIKGNQEGSLWFKGRHRNVACLMKDLPQKVFDLLDSVPLELHKVLDGMVFNAWTSL